MVTFDESSAVNDATPLDNLFITEYMLRAPGEYVKVYIYALMLCHHPRKQLSLEGFAKDLNMPSEDVEKAFRYWEREGLARQVGDNPKMFAIQTAFHVAFEQATNPGSRMYNRRFVNEINRLLDGQTVNYTDFQTIFDWVDDYELPEEVVLMLLSMEKKRRKDGVVFIQTLTNTAKEWADRGIRTVEDVEKIIVLGKKRDLELKKLLARLGQVREPSDDEKAMYRKWLDDWGFTPDAVQEACRETTKGVPTMAYLDGILLRQHQLGHHDVKTMTIGMSSERTIREFAKRVLASLGRGAMIPSEDDLGFILKWEEKGYEDEFVMYAARAVHRRYANAGLEDVDNQLTRWVEKGINSVAVVQLEVMKTREKNDFLREVFAKCAPGRQRPTEQDREMLTRWESEYQMPREVILLAAEYAQGRPSPMGAVNTILRDWNAADIHTVDRARQEHEQHVKTPKSPLQAVQSAADAHQRHSEEDRRTSARAAVVDLDGGD